MGKALQFLAGMGTGYLNAEERKRKDAIDEQERADRKEERDLRVGELKQAVKDRQTIRDAGADRATTSGTAVTTGAGDQNLYTDPAQAEAARKEAVIEAEMRGQDPAAVTAQPATGVVAAKGTLATGNQIQTGPVDVAAMNTPEEKMKRVIAAQAGIDPVKGMQLEAGAIDLQAKRLGLKVEEGKYLDDKFNRDIVQAIGASPDWTTGAANFLTTIQVGPLKGVTVNARPSADGKTVDFVGAGPDGKEVVLKSYPNSDEGKLAFMQQLQRAPLQNKLQAMQDAQKAKQDQANKDREFQAGRDDAAFDRQYKGGVLALRAASGTGGGGRAGGATGGASDLDLFDPLQGFDPKNAQSEATSQVDAVLSQSSDPVDPATRAKMISQRVFALKDAYAKENSQRYAATVAQRALAASKNDPVAYAAEYQAAIETGMNPAQLERMGFKPPAAPTKAPAAAAPAAAAGTAAPRPAATPPAAKAPAQAPAAPMATVSPLAKAFGMGPSGGAMNAVLAPTVAKAEAAAGAIAMAKSNLAAAAKSGDAKALAVYARELQAARAGVDALTRQMQDSQRNAVRSAVGY